MAFPYQTLTFELVTTQLLCSFETKTTQPHFLQNLLLGAFRAPVTYETGSQKESFNLIVAVITFNYKFLVQLETIQSTIS